MKTVCVILNYNDAETAARLAGRIRDYKSLDHIILVDNASTDDSFLRLKQLESPRITVLRAASNGGYGAGNNLGVRYGAEQLGAEYVLIANPDVMFTDRCVRGLSRLLDRHPEVGTAAAVMVNGTVSDVPAVDVPSSAAVSQSAAPVCGSALQPPAAPVNAWRLHGFAGELLYMGPVSRRLFHRCLFYPPSYFRGKKAALVDVVHGSMLMVRAEAFGKCGGYDEGIFLYQEEMVLGRRMRAAGYRTALLLGEQYVHQDSVSVKKSIADALKRQRLRETSVMYYMEHYLGIGPVRKIAAKLWFWIIRLETRVFVALGGDISAGKTPRRAKNVRGERHDG